MKKITITTAISLLLVILSGAKVNAQQGEWVQVYSNSNSFEDIACPDTNLCYVVGGQGAILKTTDGGQTWQSKTNGIFGTPTHITIYCTNKNTCYINGNNSRYKTIDGGENWIEKIVVNTPRNIFFVSDSIGYYFDAVTDIFKTVDAGNNWNLISFGPAAGFDIWFTDKNTGYLTGGRANPDSSYIFKTINGGKNWSVVKQDTTTSIGMYGNIFFSSNNVGYVSGANTTFLKTTDAGATWTEVNTPFNDSLTPYSPPYFIDDNTGYIAWSKGAGNHVRILKTMDGGITWDIDTPAVERTITEFDFPDANTGYAIAYGGTIYKLKTQGVGIFDQKDIEMATIYPNPSQSHFIIEAPQEKSFMAEIYNITGQQVRKISLKKGYNKITTANLPKGIYTILLKDKNKIISRNKIIIQ